MSVEVIGHRGARGLMPENTLEGFALCHAIGVRAIEFDVWPSLEGVPVVTHDPRPNPDLVRGAGGNWPGAPLPPVCRTPLAALKQLDVGGLRPGSAYGALFPEQAFLDRVRIPTLAEALAAAPPDTRLVIEIKSDPRDPDLAAAALACARSVCGLLDGHPLAGRAVISSFDWQALAIARALMPDLARSHLTHAGPPGVATPNLYCGSPWLTGPFLDDTVAMVAGQGGQVWAPWHGGLDAAGMAAARAAGLRVMVWTVNEAPDIDRMLDLGVDGIITDYPGRVQRRLAARRG